jgi:hypothetical protein
MKSFFALLIAAIFALAFADNDFYNAENPTECAPPGEKELFFKKYNVTTGKYTHLLPGLLTALQVLRAAVWIID